MRSYAEEIGDITDCHLEVYEAVVRIVKELPSGLSYHQVCREIHQLIPMSLEPVRGWFARKGIEHSWLRFPDEVIIDPYPVASINASYGVHQGPA